MPNIELGGYDSGAKTRRVYIKGSNYPGILEAASDQSRTGIVRLRLGPDIMPVMIPPADTPVEEFLENLDHYKAGVRLAPYIRQQRKIREFCTDIEIKITRSKLPKVATVNWLNSVGQLGAYYAYIKQEGSLYKYVLFDNQKAKAYRETIGYADLNDLYSAIPSWGNVTSKLIGNLVFQLEGQVDPAKVSAINGFQTPELLWVPLEHLEAI